MPAKLRLRDTLASIHQTRGAAFTWRPLQKMYGYKSLSPVLIFHQSEYCILAFFGKYWLLNWHEIDIQIRFPFTRFNLPLEWVLINFAFGQILANWHDRFAAICTKGQIISKRLLVPLDSSKRRTNRIGFLA